MVGIAQLAGFAANTAGSPPPADCATAGAIRSPDNTVVVIASQNLAEVSRICFLLFLRSLTDADEFISGNSRENMACSRLHRQ
jgi:hypothetical protein